MINLAPIKAIELNKLRELFGPPGAMFLLRYDGKDEGGLPQYVQIKAYSEAETVNGWAAETVRGQDQAFYTSIQIADVDGALAQIIDDPDEQLTDCAIDGRVFKLEPGQIERPVQQPLVWTLRGYETANRYEP